MNKHKFKWEIKEGLSTENVLGTKPLMVKNEIEYIEKILKPHHIMFEWGSGGSTIYFPKFVKKYYSVESQYHWFRFVRNKLRNEKDIFNKTSLKYIQPNEFYPYEDEPIRNEFTDYIEYIGKTGETKYDVVLVDGINKSRLYCVIECLKYIDDNGIVLVHDYSDRDKLKEGVDKYLDVYEVVNTLAIGRKKL